MGITVSRLAVLTVIPFLLGCKGRAADAVYYLWKLGSIGSIAAATPAMLRL